MKEKELDKVGLKELDEKLSANAEKEKLAKNIRNSLADSLEKLKKKVEELEKEAIKIKESNLKGAYQIVANNKMKSDAAQARVTFLFFCFS